MELSEEELKTLRFSLGWTQHSLLESIADVGNDDFKNRWKIDFIKVSDLLERMKL